VLNLKFLYSQDCYLVKQQCNQDHNKAQHEHHFRLHTQLPNSTVCNFCVSIQAHGTT